MASSQIFIIGDSISSPNFVTKEELYISILEKNLKPSFNVEIISCGVGGMFSGGGISILSFLYKNFYPHCFDPKICVLAIGINDFYCNIPLDQTKQVMENFIICALEKKSIPILGKIDTSYFYPQFPMERIIEFNNIFESLSKKYEIPMFDFLTPELMNNPNNHIGDRVHPNAKGHRKIADNLESVILPLLKIIFS